MLIQRYFLTALLSAWLPMAGIAQDLDAPARLNDGWPVASPTEAGLDPDALIELTSLIDAAVSYPNVHALLITHQGRLVFEHYWPGEDQPILRPSRGTIPFGPDTPHDIRSISKSVTSLLLGIALGTATDATLDRPITSFFPDRTALGSGLETVTLHHVLTMTAGLDWNEEIVHYSSPDNDFIRMTNSDDPVGFVLSKPLRHAPGDRWIYHSGLTELTADIIETLTGMPLTDFAEQMLFAPLGIDNYTWWRPDAWDPQGIPNASAGLRLRARDLAKIGSLILHHGTWQGQQIVPADWITTSTTQHVDNPWGRFGYGYFWSPGTLISGEPTIAAFGSGGQRLYVLPDADLTITIFAGNYDGCCPDLGERIAGRIVRAIRAR